jgi:flagellar biosynthesis repressor protein FlbT
MGLKVILRRGERLFIGGGSIRDENQNIALLVEGTLPLLRERDMLTAETADTAAKRLVLALQHIYLTQKHDELHEIYVLFARDALRALPDGASLIANIDEHIQAGEYFKALKEARDLVAFESNRTGGASEGPAASGKKRVMVEVPKLVPA